MPLRYLIQRVTCLAVPPLFYIIAAEKDRLKGLSQIGPLVQSTQSNEDGIPNKIILNLKNLSCKQAPEESPSAGAEGTGVESGGACADGGVQEGGVGADRGDDDCPGEGASAEGGDAGDEGSSGDVDPISAIVC